MAWGPAMAATASGKTSMRSHCRDWITAAVVFEAMISPWYNPRPRATDPALLRPSPTPTRKVTHGQTLRDLRQDAAVRTSRQPRQEPGQPEVHAQPPDGPCHSGRQDSSCPRLHPLPQDVLRLGLSP